MEWLIGIIIFAFLFYHFIMVKNGNLDFWKIANANPEEAYLFFEKSPHFVTFDTKPNGGYKSNLPPGNWEGPFKLPVPSQGKLVTIYGHSPEYQAAQNDFIRNIKAK